MPSTLAMLQNFNRVDFYAAHCHARTKSCVPLSIFYGVAGVTNGAVKAYLPGILSTMPAAVTFLVYLYELQKKCKENFDKHPESIDLVIKKEKLVDIASSIVRMLQKNPKRSRSYLEKFDLGSNQKKLLVTSDVENETVMIQAFDVFYEMFDKVEHQHAGFTEIFIESLLHGFMQLNEFFLLRYYADLDLADFPDFSAKNIMVMIMFAGAILASLQAFYFTMQPKKPNSNKLWNTLADDFRLFRKNRGEGYLLEEKSDIENQIVPAKVKEIAEHDALVECSLHCHGL